MPFRYILFILIASSVAGISFSLKKPEPAIEELFHIQMSEVIQELSAFEASIQQQIKLPELKNHFIRTRLAYKRASVLSDYFFPGLFKNINVPDLSFAEEDNPDVIFEPHGFQVLERIIYGEFADTSYVLLRNEVQMLSDIFASMNGQPGLSGKFRNELVFDALRSGVIRLVSLGITGFDSPISLNSLKESEAVLMGMKEILMLYKEQSSVDLTVRAKNFIERSRNFNSFDRLTFIQDFGDPLYAQLVKAGKEAGFILPEERRPLNQHSAGIFSGDLFDINFFSPNQRYRVTPERVHLGSLLFYDSILSINNNRSCASCHHPSKAFTDGLRVPVGSTGSAVIKRNTPTLTGAAFQTRFFYDSRTSTLENQLNTVVHNVDEMNGSLETGIQRIKNHPVYFSLFRKSYNSDDEPVTEYNIANAISSYVRSLSNFNTRFDRYMRGEGQLNGKEKDGFNLFAGKAKCATCHFIPLFNGLAPPQFTETESEVLGVPEKNVKNFSRLDNDPGKYLFTRSEVNKHAFKTPTLRNITLTAPYMHNGVYNTLEEVMDFYNKGGGKGIKTAPENQTLPPDELRLSKKEIKNIIAFLGTLSET